LSVYGPNEYYYGDMTYDARKNKYTFKQKSVPDPGDRVMVKSSLGGYAEKEVKRR